MKDFNKQAGQGGYSEQQGQKFEKFDKKPQQGQQKSVGNPNAAPKKTR